MGRRSTKENKNIYQLSREETSLTREAAAEALGFISADRIEKIENEKSIKSLHYATTTALMSVQLAKSMYQRFK